MSGRPHNPNDPSVMASVESALTPVSRPGLLSLIWNWRWEFILLATSTTVALAIAITTGIVALAAVSGAGLAIITTLLCWSPARKRIKARFWCIITPHRVRAGCAQAWVQTRQGKLPIVVWTSPTDYGERVLLWCRAGITPRDISAAREVIATACWAADVRVLPHQRRSHLVRLEIIRHFPERAVVPLSPRPDPDDREDETTAVMATS